jgi:hypothetical protein
MPLVVGGMRRSRNPTKAHLRQCYSWDVVGVRPPRRRPVTINISGLSIAIYDSFHDIDTLFCRDFTLPLASQPPILEGTLWRQPA